MYGSESAPLYDTLHTARGKDFAAEAAEATDAVLGRRPEARSLLDVACGTGAHLEHFGTRFDRVEGVDLSGPMLQAAARRLPSVPLTRGDMRTFDLGRTFDAITCLFCSIAYTGSAADLKAALERFAAHLRPGGVAVVEPWWFPEDFTPGHVAGDVVRSGDTLISRMSHSRREGDRAVMRVHYSVADSQHGLSDFTEEHRYTLFHREDYEQAFADAGFDVEYVSAEYTARGLFVGVRR